MHNVKSCSFYKIAQGFTTVDPLAEHYYSWSPYVYALNNPIRYLDPNGLWVEDENGNLVAEDKDNQETLAKYLNTTNEIALQMMIEQFLGISSNKEEKDSNEKAGVKAGDTFTLGKDRYGDKVGGNGELIQSQAGSQFSKDLFYNYWNGKGDIELKGKRFADILMYLKKKGVSPPNHAGGVVISFYDSNEYALAFGSATIYYNDKGQAIGFYDNYDFDSKNWSGEGSRTIKNELKTRAVNLFSPSQAKSFKIRYGK